MRIIRASGTVSVYTFPCLFNAQKDSSTTIISSSFTGDPSQAKVELIDFKHSGKGSLWLTPPSNFVPQYNKDYKYRSQRN